jgi:hypothetical protein
MNILIALLVLGALGIGLYFLVRAGEAPKSSKKIPTAGDFGPAYEGVKPDLGV